MSSGRSVVTGPQDRGSRTCVRVVAPRASGKRCETTLWFRAAGAPPVGARRAPRSRWPRRFVRRSCGTNLQRKAARRSMLRALRAPCSAAAPEPYRRVSSRNHRCPRAVHRGRRSRCRRYRSDRTRRRARSTHASLAGPQMEEVKQTTPGCRQAAGSPRSRVLHLRSMAPASQHKRRATRRGRSTSASWPELAAHRTR